MNRRLRLLERMRANPRGDWTIQDIQAVARRFEDKGLRVQAPTRGSHYKVSHPDVEEILTIPATRPLKPVYIRRFVGMVDSIT